MVTPWMRWLMEKPLQSLPFFSSQQYPYEVLTTFPFPQTGHFPITDKLFSFFIF
jgi:hypothetical protein